MDAGTTAPRRLLALVLASAFAACADSPPTRSQDPPPAADASRPGRPDAAHAPPPPVAPDAALPGPRAEGTDFGAEVKATFRRLFCAGEAPDPSCQRVEKAIQEHRRKTLADLRGFLAREWTGGPPGLLLYPFSGGDLMGALAAFPGAARVVMLSLEKGGPPDPLGRLSPGSLDAARRRFSRLTVRQVAHGYSHTRDLQSIESEHLPGILPLLLLGLRVHGGQPTGLRYFRIEPGGEVRWLTAADLAAPAAARPTGAPADHTGWGDPGFNTPHSHLALRFRLPGDPREREVWHVTVDLSNPGLAHIPALAPFLDRLGRTTVLLKAASYLLLKDRYSRIRDLTFAKADGFLSDNSAPDPGWLRAQGFALRLHGHFRCPVMRDYRTLAAPWVREFARRDASALPFTFGYRDCGGQSALIIGHRVPGPGAAR